MQKVHCATIFHVFMNIACSLSNDQKLLSSISTYILGHRNQKNRSIISDFRYLFNLINENAENPASLLFSIGIVIIDAQHILFRRINLIRYLNYSKSVFSHFLKRHHFNRICIKDIETDSINIQIFIQDRYWTAYKLNDSSVFNLLLLSVPFLWANNESIKKAIGVESPILSLLNLFRPMADTRNYSIVC